MSNELIKQTERVGMKISKEKLIELLRKSTQREFAFSQANNRNAFVIVIASWSILNESRQHNMSTAKFQFCD